MLKRRRTPPRSKKLRSTERWVDELDRAYEEGGIRNEGGICNEGGIQKPGRIDKHGRIDEEVCSRYRLRPRTRVGQHGTALGSTIPSGIALGASALSGIRGRSFRATAIERAELDRPRLGRHARHDREEIRRSPGRARRGRVKTRRGRVKTRRGRVKGSTIIWGRPGSLGTRHPFTYREARRQVRLLIL
jgi:hypothetical protein